MTNPNQPAPDAPATHSEAVSSASDSTRSAVSNGAEAVSSSSIVDGSTLLRELTVDEVDREWMIDLARTYRASHALQADPAEIVSRLFVPVAAVVIMLTAIVAEVHFSHHLWGILCAEVLGLVLLYISTEAWRDRFTVRRQREIAEQALDHYKERLVKSIENPGSTDTDGPTTANPAQHASSTTLHNEGSQLYLGTIPLRNEYNWSRFANRSSKSTLRLSLQIPNMWIPMRYAHRFHDLHSMFPYHEMLYLLRKNRDYVPSMLQPALWITAQPLSILLLCLALSMLAIGGIAPEAAIGPVVIMFVAIVIVLLRAYSHYNKTKNCKRLIDDEPCLACGYPLSSIVHRDGHISRCPECGSSLTTLDICLKHPSPRPQSLFSRHSLLSRVLAGKERSEVW